MDKNFWRAGHVPTLLTAFLYFDLAFMVWYLLGPLQLQIAADLHLNAKERGLMVATPILSGAILRFFMGLLVDRVKPKMAGAFGQVVVIIALTIAWYFGVHSLNQALLLGLFLGVAGASFAVALPLASRWYPPEHQGTAMGIAGAGNSGTVLAALFAPALGMMFGWPNVFGLAVIPLSITFLIYMVFAKDAPGEVPKKTMSDYLQVLSDKDAWWFMFFYCITFGGFSGFASGLPAYFHDEFGFEAKQAGLYTAACVLAGSVMRPLGGTLADRIGGVRALSVVYTCASFMIMLVGFKFGGANSALLLFVFAMLFLGMGNGAVFQLVPQRFRKEIGVMTGLIGMAGGIGGFLLAAGLGSIKQATNSYSTGLWCFAGLAIFAWVGLVSVKKRWHTTWGSAALTTARV